MTVVALFALVALLLFLRVNIVLILMIGAVYAQMVWGAGELCYFAEDVWTAMDREPILAVPMFIFVGAIMSRGSIANRLVALMVALTRWMPGGLGVATILSCAIFSAISGSSIVTMLVIGSVLYPALQAHGYSKKFAIGALCAGGTLGIIIPPSIPMIIYGIITETSIQSLFTAGIGPGILLTGLFATYSVVGNLSVPRERSRFSEIWETFVQGIPALMMPVILLGGIYSGFFSPTESAAVAILYVFVVETLFYRELKFKDYYDIAVESAKLVGVLFPLIAVAISMNLLLTEHRVPHHLITFMLEHIDSQTQFILLTNLILLIVGCFMDTASAIAIASPLLKPVAEAYGMDPTHLGVIIVLNLEIGILTPPLGLNLIVAMTAFKEKFGLICLSVLPFVALMLLALLLVTFQPWIAMGLVN